MKDERLGALNEVIDSFHAEHPNIKVVPEYVDGYGNLYTKTTNAIATGRLPDLALAYEPMISSYASQGVVIALDSYISSPKHGFTRADLDDLFPIFIASNRYSAHQNRMLSFPFAKSVLVMYYNRDLLKLSGINTVPETWNAFEAACKAVAAHTSARGYIIDIDASTILGWIYSRGGDVLQAKNRRPTLNSPEAIESMTLVNRLIRDGSGYLIGSRFEDQEDFGSGRVAFVLTTSSGLYYAEHAMARGARADWGVRIIPQAAGKTKRPTTVLYGPNIVVFRSTSERQLAAWLFIRYFASQRIATDWAMRAHYLPLRRSVVRSQSMKTYLAAFPQYAQALEVLKFAKPEPNIASWQVIRNLLERALVDVAQNGVSPKEAMTRAQAKAAQVPESPP